MKMAQFEKKLVCDLLNHRLTIEINPLHPRKFQRILIRGEVLAIPTSRPIKITW